MPRDGHGATAIRGRCHVAGGMSGRPRGLWRRDDASTLFGGWLSTPLAVVCSLLGLFLLAACAGGEAQRYYVLTPIAAGQGPHDPNGVAIGIGPVDIPPYLDRQQVVTRAGNNRLDVARNDQWGGSLGDEVTRVLAEDLSDLLLTDHVAMYPWTDAAPAGLQVTVDIFRFERDGSGAVTLSAFWTVTDGSTRRIRVIRHSRIVKNIDPVAKGRDTYEATVDLMSDALVGLSLEIADAIDPLLK
jgi:uncharacterized lipoprotein YmbA